jgi:hypothetical protein
METPITVTQRELLSLAPKVHAQVINATVKRHVPREPVVQAMIERIDCDDKAEGFDRQKKAAEREERRAAHMPAAFVTAARAAEATPVTPLSREPVLRATIEEIEDEDNDESTRKRKAEARPSALPLLFPLHSSCLLCAASHQPHPSSSTLSVAHTLYLHISESKRGC